MLEHEEETCNAHHGKQMLFLLQKRLLVNRDNHPKLYALTVAMQILAGTTSHVSSRFACRTHKSSVNATSNVLAASCQVAGSVSCTSGQVLISV